MAAANPNTIVVLETGGPVTMPWADQVEGVLTAWYPGIGGAQAMANLLLGEVNPSAKLPVTSPRAIRSWHPEVPGIDLKPVDVQVPTVMRRDNGSCTMRSGSRLSTWTTTSRARGWATMVRIEEYTAAVSFRLRAVVHELRVVGPQGRRSGHEVSFG